MSRQSHLRCFRYPYDLCVQDRMNCQMILTFGTLRGSNGLADCSQGKRSTVCPKATWRETVIFLLQDTVFPSMQVKPNLVFLFVFCYKFIRSFCLLVIIRFFTNMPQGYFHPIEYVPEYFPSVFPTAVACFFLLYLSSSWCFLTEFQPL